jgi:Protein of unknown function (DUF2490)
LRMKKKIIFTLLFLFILKTNFSQSVKSTEHLQQVWAAFYNQTRFGNKWEFGADVQLRTKEKFFNNFSQAIFRPDLSYYLNDETKLTLGYAYINVFPGDNHKNISQPEHRPWQQILWHTRYSKFRLLQFLRLEERFKHKILNNDELADGYNFNYRLQYNFLAQVPLSKKKFQPNTFSFFMSSDLFINFGKQIIYNYFDQARFSTGFTYHVNKHDNLQVGWMNIFQQLSAGNKYRSNNVVRVSYFQNLDLRNKKPV